MKPVHKAFGCMVSASVNGSHEFLIIYVRVAEQEVGVRNNVLRTCGPRKDMTWHSKPVIANVDVDI
jgi:hypothetical protein